MRRCIHWLRRNFRRDGEGTTAVEYAVMLALILLLCVSAIRVLGCNVNVVLRNAARSIAN